MRTEHIVTPEEKNFGSEVTSSLLKRNNKRKPIVPPSAVLEGKVQPIKQSSSKEIPEQPNVENEAGATFTNKSKKHIDVLTDLLNELQPFDFARYLNLSPDDKLKVTDIVVAIIMKLLETAKLKRWNLAKYNDYVYIYNGKYWHQMEKDDLKQFLGECAMKMGCQINRARYYGFKDELLRQFYADAHLPQPIPDPKKILINLQNGTYQFTPSGWKHRPHDPADFMTYILPFHYDELATCPLFDNYLLKVLPDESSRLLLQEFCGYIFTKLNLEKMLMLTGSGANGKSVFFNVITALLGRQNVLTYSMGLFQHEYNRAKLTNVLLNYSSEKGTELDPDTLKALASGEPLQAREPYGKSFTLYNTVRFIFNTNKLPREVEDSEAYFRRFLIIPFDVTIPESERDTELADKIINVELAGVFNWLLLGVARIMKNKKFTDSKKANEASENFRRQSDSVALFIEEFNYKPSENKLSVKELYNAYKTFCNDDGYRALSKNNFSGRLETKGFERSRLNDGSSAFKICRYEKKT